MKINEIQKLGMADKIALLDVHDRKEPKFPRYLDFSEEEMNEYQDLREKHNSIRDVLLSLIEADYNALILEEDVTKSYQQFRDDVNSDIINKSNKG